MSDQAAEYPTAKAFLPPRISLKTLREAAAECRGCDLYQSGTQTVFGEGLKRARVMFIGEQPGDREDRTGKPFVGHAGRMLDKALEEAEIDRDEVYVTNAVKHFKWAPRGKRRIHSKPSARQIAACRPWLESEIRVVRPQTIICLGATAAQALLGRDFRLTRARGQVFQTDWAPRTLATVHPSSLLRIPERDERERAYRQFIQDLRQAASPLTTQA